MGVEAHSSSMSESGSAFNFKFTLNMKKLLLSLVFILSLGGIVADGFQPCVYAYEETSRLAKKKTKSRASQKSQKSTTSKKSGSASKPTDSRGPVWIEGTWVYKGNVPTSWGPMYTNGAVSINRNSQTLVFVLDKDVVENGHYSVYDGAIHCGSTYWNLDESNHRIEIGNGVYMHKK